MMKVSWFISKKFYRFLWKFFIIPAEDEEAKKKKEEEKKKEDAKKEDTPVIGDKALMEKKEKETELMAQGKRDLKEMVAILNFYRFQMFRW